MILMPPGSAKSTYASVIFPAWWFTQHPRSSVITASHSASLARHFSRRVRALILEKEWYLGFSIKRGERSADQWTTSSGGEYLAVGVRGAIAGRRADLVIVDDPVRSRADAESARQRNHVWDWFKSDVTTRLKPGGKIVLIMTRWHPDDLGGQLLARDDSEWRIVRLPALAEPDDPLGRPVGSRCGRNGRTTMPLSASGSLWAKGHGRHCSSRRPCPPVVNCFRSSVLRWLMLRRRLRANPSFGPGIWPPPAIPVKTTRIGLSESSCSSAQMADTSYWMSFAFVAHRTKLKIWS